MPRGIGWTGRWGVLPLVQRVGDGYRVNLGRVERQVLMQTFDDLRALLANHDPVTRRLFPTAYVDEPELEQEFRDLVGDDLARSQVEALDLVERTIDGTTVDADELETWMRAVNSVRLVIGTALDLGEEPVQLDAEDPSVALYQVYDFLTFLLGTIVSVLASDGPLTDGPDPRA